MNEELYQIGLPIDRLSNVMLNFVCNEPRTKLVITPSLKQDDYVVVETRNKDFAACVIKDVPEAKVKIINLPVKTIKL